MRAILPLFFSGVLMAQAQTPNPSAQAEQLYNKGVAAEKAGDPVTAQKSYSAALRLNPQHANARYRAAQMKIEGGSIAAKGREAKFGQEIIPQIALEGASLQESLDALRLMIEKNAGPEKAPNFIVQDPENKLDKARITLQLKGVPAKGVLSYILTQSGAKATYDEHAVVISPYKSGS